MKIHGTKYCGSCKALRPIREFGKNKSQLDGLDTRCKDCSRRNQLKSKFNITPEDYDRMLEDQGGRCAICKRHWSTLNRRLGIDHNHETGQIRGLLCAGCNTRLGGSEGERWIEKAAIYLVPWRFKST